MIDEIYVDKLILQHYWETIVSVVQLKITFTQHIATDAQSVCVSWPCY